MTSDKSSSRYLLDLQVEMSGGQSQLPAWNLGEMEAGNVKFGVINLKVVFKA